MKPRDAAALLILVASACAPRTAAPPPAESSRAESSVAPGFAITLYRGPCYSGCPVYSVSVTSDGLVSYEGRSQVRRRGTATTQILKARVDALLGVLEAAGYFTFASRYRPSELVCGRYVPDAPSVITSVRFGGRMKRIEHDHGCGGAPMALRVLESRIDEVLGSERWTGR